MVCMLARCPIQGVSLSYAPFAQDPQWEFSKRLFKHKVIFIQVFYRSLETEDVCQHLFETTQNIWQPSANTVDEQTQIMHVETSSFSESRSSVQQDNFAQAQHSHLLSVVTVETSVKV